MSLQPQTAAPAPPKRRVQPAVPRTPSQLLLAGGGDPFDRARAAVDSALATVHELLGFLPAEQDQLHGRFTTLASMLDADRRMLADWRLVPAEQQLLGTVTPPTWGEYATLAGAPAGRTPVNPDPQAEPVYGFNAVLGHVGGALKSATDALAQFGGQLGSSRRFLLAGNVANAAADVDHLAAMFTAAVWDYERPAMPTLPARSGRIELRASPRARPQTRWARYARAMFVADRVEFTTAQGRRVIGLDTPIEYLLHVAPPSPVDVLAPYDPAERYARVPLYDELGAVHFCNAAGQSMGAIAVADWLVQPEVTQAQSWSAAPGAEHLRAHGRLVWALQASGITAGAATLRVPIRRGVAHPPMADPSRVRPKARAGATGVASAPNPAAMPIEAVADVIRPAPHLLPYRGTAARPADAHRRRAKRGNTLNKDTGPASPLNAIIRWPALAAIIIGGLGSAYLLANTWWVRTCVILMFAAVLEPWLWWLWSWARDHDVRRMKAVYRPGAAPGRSNRFSRRAALLFDGANVGIRTATGHEAWLAASSDTDIGLVSVQRLMHQGQAWAFALTDRWGHWRAVLPAEAWAPGGDLSGLAGFAQAAGLELGDTSAVPFTVANDPLQESSAFAATRSTGPRTRGMVMLGIYALSVAPLTLLGSRTATFMLFLVAAIALTPTFLRFVWNRWLDRPSAAGEADAGRRSATRVPMSAGNTGP
ncbi:hypothetical protein EXU48_20010 [Occultella glacieicola]|uniref:Uncharacterized protein n=1 Tax=Occultella glacieicola TaxID=2518684 RepID=A0ABY2DYY5_9MICO|nr:hypothetical protein [Occultella glacieicola]TDE89705.1 hypothetical protein EXU48_20010 [Occultella glacieicola]